MKLTCFAIRNIFIVLIAGVLMTVTAESDNFNDYYTSNNNSEDDRKRPKNKIKPYRGSDDPLYSFLTSSTTTEAATASGATTINNRWNDPFKTLTYKLKVATFNIWGLLTSKDRSVRISAITRYFTKNPRGLDILCLQELWMADDYRSVRAALSLEFPHAHYFKSGVVGSGLAVFSKYPIVEAWWKGFTLTGKAHRLFDGDWYAGKGIGAVRIRHPTIGLIDVFNTHVSKQEFFFK